MLSFMTSFMMRTKWAIYGPQTNQLSGPIFTHNLGNSAMANVTVTAREDGASSSSPDDDNLTVTTVFQIYTRTSAIVEIACTGGRYAVLGH